MPAVGLGAGYAPMSYQDRKYQSAVRQVFDFTCGSAALATLLTHYWGRPTTETEVLDILRHRYPDEATWRRLMAEGFSFDDIRFVALVLGFESAGAKIAIGELAALSGPVIIHLDKGHFQHFTVLRKAHGGVFYFADSILGNTSLPRYEFEKQYTGHAMAIWKADANLPTGSRLAVVKDGLSLHPRFGQPVRPPPTVGVFP
jgi:uncharacterized protein